MPTSPLRGGCFCEVGSGSVFGSTTQPAKRAAVGGLSGGCSSEQEEEAGEKLITANDIRAAHARGEQAITSSAARWRINTPEAREWRNCWASRLHRMRRVRPGITSAQAWQNEASAFGKRNGSRKVFGFGGAVDGKVLEGRRSGAGTGDDAAELYLRREVSGVKSMSGLWRFGDGAEPHCVGESRSGYWAGRQQHILPGLCGGTTPFFRGR